MSLHYDHLVVATGASARPSPWGGQRPGIHVLRTLEDCLRLRADLVSGGRLVVVGGGGFIGGAEVASTARTLGQQVAIIDPVQVPMSRVLDEEIGGGGLSIYIDATGCARGSASVWSVSQGGSAATWSSALPTAAS